MSTWMWIGVGWVFGSLMFGLGWALGSAFAKGEIAALREARKRDWVEWEGILERRAEWQALLANRGELP